MGLSAPRKRRKFNADPQNTSWTRNDATYGQRMLQKQGWQSGETLGARNASHKPHFTTASNSYIRVTLKDDTLGLGANAAKNDEARNMQRMGAYQDVLSRLNGAAEKIIQHKREKREDMKRVLYAEQKYGPMRFVRGGFLIGNEMKEKVISSSVVEAAPQPQPQMDRLGPDTVSKGKCINNEKDERRKRRAEKRLKKEEKRQRKEYRKLRREQKKRKPGASDETLKTTDQTASSVTEEITTPTKTGSPDGETEGNKFNKGAQGEIEQGRDITDNTTHIQCGNASSSREAWRTQDLTSYSNLSQVDKSFVSTPRGMHAVRRRYIQQKKMVGQNQQAMQEVLMARAG